jgi:hypothetical protein
MAFVLNAIPYLSPCGHMVAVLPSGCLHTQKDRQAWELLSAYLGHDLLFENPDNTWRECRPKTTIVQFHRRANVPELRSLTKATGPAIALDEDELLGEQPPPAQVELFRGKIGMHSVPKERVSEGVPLVHSTGLSVEHVDTSRYRVTIEAAQRRSITGPAVLFPRVCLPKRSKLTIYLGDQAVALSDCVLAVLCNSPQEARAVYHAMYANWCLLEAAYGGTCAPYITLEEVEKFLASIGIASSVNKVGRNTAPTAPALVEVSRACS